MTIANEKIIAFGKALGRKWEINNGHNILPEFQIHDADRYAELNGNIAYDSCRITEQDLKILAFDWLEESKLHIRLDEASTGTIKLTHVSKNLSITEVFSTTSLLEAVMDLVIEMEEIKA